MKLKIEIEAAHIDWKELISKINEAVDEEVTDLCCTKMSYSDCEPEDDNT